MKAIFPLMLLAVFGCGISAWAEFSLFVSFAPDADDLLAPVTAALGALGVLFVVGQFVLADQAARRYRSGQIVLARVCAAACAVLLAVSISGTASWFESAYQQGEQVLAAETEPAPAVALAMAVTAQDIATAGGLLATAGAEEERGNHWRAGELRRQAAEINQRAAGALKQFEGSGNERQIPAATQASVTGRVLGDRRGWLWLAIATLTDLIPLLAVVLMALPAEQQAGTDEHNEPAARPDCKPQGEPVQTSPNKPNQTAKRFVVPGGGVVQTIADHIQRTGQVPTKRQAQAMGVGYTRYSNALAELAGLGVVRPRGSGRGYEVV
ncbi:hypothetical protein [Thalassolituus pacificus]|uniref:Uncharacterized protein n=1 Tax=Thalassolituus pacificus TaxID=2975440 RepID=A0A9X2WBQ1_9GAMM|nr:hypothetical protein [Thalassolituus pacificus]MCT7357547.1 hypothetical protein [Thalassolituus pacificus]